LQCIVQRWIGTDGGKQRVRQRASRANWSCLTLAGKGDTDKLTDSNEQAEGQRDWRLNQTPGGRDCDRSRDERPGCREQNWRDR
jgi:hypothetical protein